MTELVNHLREFRTQRNLTQATLAEQVGVSRKTINTIENSIYVPSTLLALKLARQLKVSVHDLFVINEDKN